MFCSEFGRAARCAAYAVRKTRSSLPNERDVSNQHNCHLQLSGMMGLRQNAWKLGHEMGTRAGQQAGKPEHRTAYPNCDQGELRPLECGMFL